jgi:hypothetical protein
MMLATASTLQFSESSNADPRVRVWMNSNAEYQRGDRARVYVRTTDDGYLVVLHADTQGRIRVLFPLDPGDDNYARGGDSFEVRGRGDRDAFLIEDKSGGGLVLAAWSPDPFQFDRLSLNNHWDYRVMAANVREDREAGLLDVVQQMTLNQFFEYDAAQYIVGHVSYGGGGGSHTSFSISIGSYNPWCWGCFDWHVGYRSGFHVSFGIGSFGYDRWYYDPWYDPFYYDPWYRYGHPWYYRPVYVRPVIYYPSRWWWDPWPRGPRHFRSGIGIHTRYAGCWGDPWCRRRDAHPRGGLGIEPGWATGWATNWSQGGGPNRGGTGVGIGFGPGSTRQAVQRTTATVYNPVPRSTQFEQPQSNRMGTVLTEPRPDTRNRAAQAVRENETPRTQPGRTATTRSTPRGQEFPTEPQRARVRPGVGSEVAPPVSTTEPRRERVVPNFERQSQPGRASISEPTRTRVNPNVERQAQPGRASISEPTRTRVNPNVERQAQPGRASISEPTRTRVNPNVERQAQPGRASISEPPRSRVNSNIERQPSRSSVQPPSRSEVRRSVAPDRSQSAISRNSSRSSISSSPPRSQAVTPQRSSPSVRNSPPSRSSGSSSRINAQPRSSGSSGSISRSSGSSGSSRAASSSGRGIARKR